MVESSEEFRAGIAAASEDIDALKRVEKKCRDFFTDFVAYIRCEDYDGLNLVWQIDRFSLRLLAENGGTETWVASVTYDLERAQLFYGDARLASLYPLPLKVESMGVLAKYFGVSLGWIAHGSHLIKLPGVGLGFRVSVEEKK